MAVIMMQHCKQATKPLQVTCKAETLHKRLPISEQLWERLWPHNRDSQVSTKPDPTTHATMNSLT